VGVIDGDTVRVLHDTTQVKVRLAGIDAPESKQPWGIQAKWYLWSLVFSQVVQVVEQGTDRYGRLIAELWVPISTGTAAADGVGVRWMRNVNQALVAEGHAWVYIPYARYDPQLPVLEQQARALRLGLWANPRPVAPWLWRKGSR
jgi:endonuclease YncB( thermonuclease family)